MTQGRMGLWVDLITWCIAIGVVYASRHDLALLTLEELGWIGLALAAWTIGRIATREPYGPLSAAAVYQTLLCIFHLGLVGALALGVEPSTEIEQGTWRWLYTDETAQAMVLALLGILGCAVGSTTASLVGTVQVPRIAVSDRADLAMGQIGSVITVASVALWGALLVRGGGIGVFATSYMSMQDAVEGTPIIYVYVLLHVGVPMMAATRWRWTHRWGWSAFAVFSVLALAMGIRGQVMMTFAACLPALAMRGLRVRASHILLGSVLLLTAIGVIRDVRTVGLARVSEAQDISVNPADGLMELGSSIRPVAEVIKWHDAGDPFIWGASYWATIDRPARRFLPGLERIPAEADERIMNVLVLERQAGAIGFSPIAEAFRNFGPPGVVGVLWLTGLLMGFFDRLPRRGAWPALVSVSLVPIYLQVRNSFVHVPAGVVFGIACVLGVVAWFDWWPSTQERARRQQPQDGSRQRPMP